MTETVAMGGLQLRFLQTREETSGSLDAFEMVVQPDGQMPVPHYHESWDETVIGQMGVTNWRVDGQEIALLPGHSIFIKRGIVHSFRNDSGEAGSCLCILTPGALGAGYFREMAGLLASVPPDTARMKEVMQRYGLVPAPGG